MFKEHIEILKAAIDFVAKTMSGNEAVVEIRMGALELGKNAQFPLVIDIGTLSDDGQQATAKR